MSISRLPMAAKTLLRVMMSGNADQLLAAFHRDASVFQGGEAYAAKALRGWAEAFISGAPLDVRVMSRGGGGDELVLAVQIVRAGSGGHPRGRCAWRTTGSFDGK